MVPAMGVLWSAADFRYQPALDERRETRSGRSWGNPIRLAIWDVESPLELAASAKDHLVPFVFCWRVTAYAESVTRKCVPISSN